MNTPETSTIDQARRRNRRSSRRGFTVIELLVVIGIISLLSSSLLLVIGSATRTARITATKARLVKIGDLLRQRRDAFGRLELRQGEIRTVQNELVANGVPVVVARGVAPIFAFKNRYRAAFPQVWTDNPALYDPGGPLAGNIETKADSSELLLYTLTKADQFGIQSLGTDIFNADEFADTDGDGLMELVDSWGEPFRFYRWPTRLIRSAGFVRLATPGRPNATISASDLEAVRILMPGISEKILARDPDDPLGYFDRLHYWNGSGGSTYNLSKYGLVHSSFPLPPIYNATRLPPIDYREDKFHTPDTFHTPLVVSAGPDQVLGLFEPNDPTLLTNRLAQINPAVVTGSPSNSPLNDNLTNRNLRVGGN
jgi:prepilin-type N-terminal cleavage/methylation domain-containing protein